MIFWDKMLSVAYCLTSLLNMPDLARRFVELFCVLWNRSVDKIFCRVSKSTGVDLLSMRGGKLEYKLTSKYNLFVLYTRVLDNK